MARSPLKRPKNRALQRAVKRAGGQSALAAQLNAAQRDVVVTQRLVWEWLNKTGKPTPELCPVIEQVTGEPCEALHPAFARFAELRGLPQQKAAA